MFKNLRTSTKLIVLCTMFIASVAVTTYSLVVEKEIAIAFARKELTGSKFLSFAPPLYNGPNQQTLQPFRIGVGRIFP